ncbi:MAG: 3-dehydroquinate synthase [Ignavibacteriales bacterium]|nr:3-dehydroquinate synthase [Ignavibacteriales bacterium]
MIQRQIDVALGERSYPIYAGTDMVSSFASMCRQHGISDSLVIITDRNAASYHLQPLLRNLQHYKFQPTTIIVPSGENQKNLHRANTIFTELLKKRIPRTSAVIALGGGVIGDLAGFVAATYKRGIKLVQVPTTLLAQVDSSIGGKVGVNHPLGKNMIGAFHQPVFVWMDAHYLKTLPPREIICGLGEVLKYGIIRDAALFGFLELNLEKTLRLDTETVIYVQMQCAAIKAEIVTQDEKESGIRIILNYGHTIGHGLEFAGHYKQMKHGEAVLLGMLAESFIAKEMKLLDADSYKRIVALIRRIPMKTKFSMLKIADILNAIGRDKKHIGSQQRFVLPIKIGEVNVIDTVTPTLIQKAVKEILKK